MKEMTVKCFKKGDKALDVLKLKHNLEFDKHNKHTALIETYKVYFYPNKTLMMIEGLNKKGKMIFLKNCSTASSFGDDNSVYIYRKRNKTDKKVPDKDYNFIVCNKSGQVIEHEYCGGSKSTYKYDANNRLIEEVSDGSVIWKYKYDKKGRKISETKYDDDNSIRNIRKYYYDDTDRLLKRKLSEKILSGEYLDSYSLFHYDKHSNLIKEENFDWNKKVCKDWNEYKYSKDGKLVEKRDCCIAKSKTREREKIKYFYENKLLKEEIVYLEEQPGLSDTSAIKSRLYSKTCYTYDSHDRLIKKEIFQADGKLDHRYIWEYDNKKVVMDKKALATLSYFQNEGYKVLINNNRVLKEKEKMFAPTLLNDCHWEFITTYEYDKYGRLAKVTMR
ncbi:MAG: RHS repeat domain-containing protein [bacterium]